MKKFVSISLFVCTVAVAADIAPGSKQAAEQTVIDYVQLMDNVPAANIHISNSTVEAHRAKVVASMPGKVCTYTLAENNYTKFGWELIPMPVCTSVKSEN